jgi:hypothetical protein
VVLLVLLTQHVSTSPASSRLAADVLTSLLLLLLERHAYRVSVVSKLKHCDGGIAAAAAAGSTAG